MQNGRKTNMKTRQQRPAASFAARSKPWSSNTPRPEPGSHNAQRNYQRSASGHQSVDVDVQLYGRKSRSIREWRHTRANGRRPMQPHSFSRRMAAWDETGAGLFGEALRA